MFQRVQGVQDENHTREIDITQRLCIGDHFRVENVNRFLISITYFGSEKYTVRIIQKPRYNFHSKHSAAAYEVFED